MSSRVQNQGQGSVQNGGRSRGVAGDKSTDRRTGAGVDRLAGTTKKVTLRDNNKPEPVAKRKSGRPANNSGSRSGSGRSGRKSAGKDRTPISPPVVSDKDTKEKKEENADETANIDAIAQETKREGDERNEKEETQLNGEDSERMSSPQVENLDETGHNNEPELPEQSRASTPDKHKEFNIRRFSATIGEFSDKFSEERFSKVGDDYPIDDLLSLVTEVNVAIDEYKTHTLSSQQQLENLRDKMNNVSACIHDSVQTRNFEVIQEQEPTVEQKELAAKLARINAEVAQANIELARLVKMSAETESRALQAAESAVEAQEAADQIKAEKEWRERKETERKAEEERKALEEQKREEEDKQRIEDDRRKQEQEWKKREGGHADNKTAVWEGWSPYVYEMTSEESDINIACIIRGNPAQFEEHSVTCQPVNQLNSTFTFEENDELVSPILRIESTRQNERMVDPVFVAIPFIATRNSMLGREPVVKAEMEGEWKELYTREVTFEDHKEYRFAQVELPEFTTIAVVTRYKRDYLTLSRKTSKIASTADHRITLTTDRGSFKDRELYMMQVQPVDSTSINELKSRDKFMKGLLSSSPVVTTQWERADFNNPVTVTVPCPPNPAKAKKLAAMRAMKEAKMKQPLRQQHVVPIDVLEKQQEKRNKKKQPDDQDYEDRPRRTETRWYMGIYGGSDDDENDNLYLLHRYANGKWAIVPEVKVHQIKLDVLQFELETPVHRFVVLRTRTTVDENDAQIMATKLEEALAKKVVQFVLKQRVDDPFDASVHVVTSGKTDRVLKKLQDEGFEDGPDVSNDVTICEGDVIEIGFRGNLQSRAEEPLQILFNSNMRTSMEFSITEVDKYLQKNFSLFRGFIQFYRKYPIVTKPDHRPKAVQKTTEEEETASVTEPIQYHRELLTELLVNIPKYHIVPNTAPSRAQVTIINDDCVNEEVVRQLAVELGDEWRKVAHYLNVRRTRIQAILRNAQLREETEDEAKFEMMMTWLKRAPKAIDKVVTLISALERSGRPDLADNLRSRDNLFLRQKNGIIYAP